MNLPELQWLYGQPKGTATFKAQPDDFIVDEELGYPLTGEGEHLCIHLKKRNTNTTFAAEALAKWANVPARTVSYAGLKDRHATTTQWFSIQLPGKTDPDPALFNETDMEILCLKRHNKKIRTGALKGNHFRLRLTQVSNPEEAVARLAQIATQGVPNYFGEQRFGHHGNNISRALAMFNGQKVRSKTQRGLYLSAARSLLFNLIVSGRIEKGIFDRIIAGDLLQLQHSNSFFEAVTPDSELQQRIESHELNITAPLWGVEKKTASSESERALLEKALLSSHESLCLGLENAKVDAARRSVRLLAEKLSFEQKEDELNLTFFLPAGCYATSIIREVAILNTSSSQELTI